MAIQQMQRRHFFVVVAGGLTMRPLTLVAEASPVVIGFLGGQTTPPPSDAQGNALMQGFRDYGLIPGHDFIFEPRFTGGDDDRFPELARELARLKARVILANTPAGARAAQRLDPPIPVVMTLMNDPVGAGLISSLAHPGNHTTGTANLNEDLTPKILEFVRDILPNSTKVAILHNPLNPTHPPILANLRAKTEAMRIELVPLALKPRDNLGTLFSMITAEKAQAIQLLGDPAIGDLRFQLAALAQAQKLPLFSTSSIVTEAGGLLSYGGPVNKMLARMGYYVKRILDGANPGDLPVEQPTEVTLVVNLKTAKAIGIEISPSLLARANVVIE
jgi:putative tryptophan/tyrosine transport system substrate-binding protein